MRAVMRIGKARWKRDLVSVAMSVMLIGLLVNSGCGCNCFTPSCGCSSFSSFELGRDKKRSRKRWACGCSGFWVEQELTQGFGLHMIDGDDENNDHQVFDDELTAPAIKDLFAMNAGTGRDTLVESTPNVF